jgi:hypothetical protein
MMSDYLPAFLGLSEDGNWTRSGGIDVRLALMLLSWLALLTFEQLSQLRKQAAGGRSHGVHSSVEFNMLYRV